MGLSLLGDHAHRLWFLKHEPLVENRIVAVVTILKGYFLY
jgi:hypothetical protein